MDIQAVLKRVSSEEGARLKVLHNAVVNTLRAYQAESTTANLKNWQAAEAAYEQAMAKYAQADGGEQAADLFATKLEVWRFLKEDGWQIGRSQFYQHCRDGLLRPEADGRYLLDKVERYANRHLRLAATGSKINEELERFNREKAETELAREKVRLSREEYELGIKQRKFVPRDEYELAIVGRAVALQAHLKHLVQTRAADYVELVGGDLALQPDLVAAMTDDIEQRLAVFASDVEFDVILEADG